MTTLDDTEQIAKELDAIFDLYNATKTIIANEKENLKQKPYNKTDNNVIYVDFGIKAEFEEVKSKLLQVSQILDLYHDWTFRTYAMAQSNLGHYKNKKLLELIEENYELISTIVNVAKMIQEKE